MLGREGAAHRGHVLEDLPADDEVEAAAEAGDRRRYVTDDLLVVDALAGPLELVARDVEAGVHAARRPVLGRQRRARSGADVEDANAGTQVRRDHVQERIRPRHAVTRRKPAGGDRRALGRGFRGVGTERGHEPLLAVSPVTRWIAIATRRYSLPARSRSRAGRALAFAADGDRASESQRPAPDRRARGGALRVAGGAPRGSSRARPAGRRASPSAWPSRPALPRLPPTLPTRSRRTSTPTSRVPGSGSGATTSTSTTATSRSSSGGR